MDHGLGKECLKGVICKRKNSWKEKGHLKAKCTKERKTRSHSALPGGNETKKIRGVFWCESGSCTHSLLSFAPKRSAEPRGACRNLKGWTRRRGSGSSHSQQHPLESRRWSNVDGISFVCTPSKASSAHRAHWDAVGWTQSQRFSPSSVVLQAGSSQHNAAAEARHQQKHSAVQQSNLSHITCKQHLKACRNFICMYFREALRQPRL